MKGLYRRIKNQASCETAQYPYASITKEHGFSLVEVCTTSIILSIGLLGLASLHFEALKREHASFFKSIAGIQSYDLMDRMRANIEGANNGYYETVNKEVSTTKNPDCFGGVSNAVAGQGTPDRTFSDTSCDDQQIAIQDVIEWRENLQNLLPSGNGEICRSSSPGAISESLNCDGIGNLYVISVTWTSQNGDQEEYRVSFKP